MEENNFALKRENEICVYLTTMLNPVAVIGNNRKNSRKCFPIHVNLKFLQIRFYPSKLENTSMLTNIKAGRRFDKSNLFYILHWYLLCNWACRLQIRSVPGNQYRTYEQIASNHAMIH